LPASLDRAGRFFDGWLPIAPDADQWARLWNEVKEIVRTAGRNPNALTGAMYLTVITDENRNVPTNGSTLISNNIMANPLP
jgi:alkanesulfonate monooxygenase SsuD/methylene tetrahydromethanopterin reductase-like flavin-dependent oxidoreductase (luciferase family)